VVNGALASRYACSTSNAVDSRESMRTALS
jgi:hypothetical protein